MPSILARSRSALASLAVQRQPVNALALTSDDLEAKSIWGSGTGGFLDFNGISGQSGADEIQDSRGDYTRASVVESYVYKCLTVRADALVQAPLRIMRPNPDGTEGDYVNHPALDLLDFTNPFTGQVRGIAEILRYTLGSLDLHGRSAIQIATNSKGGPTELYWLPPSRYDPVQDPDAPRGTLGGLRLPNGETLKASQVIYIRNANYETPLLGVSKIQVLRDAINLRRSSVRSNKSFFANSMRPDVVVSGDWPNTWETMQRIRSAWTRTFQGDHNRAPLFLGGNAKASLLSASPKDAEWIGQQRLSGEEISSAFKVPVIYLNNFEKATYENISTAKLMLWHDGIMPDADAIASQLTREFLWRFWPETRSVYKFCFDYSNVDGLGEDVERVTNRIATVWQRIENSMDRGALTPNQGRPILLALLNQLGLPSDTLKGDVIGGDDTLDLWTKIPRGQHSMQALIDGFAARGSNPELVEDVPGAPHASSNAARAIERLQAMPSLAALPPAPPTPRPAKTKKAKEAKAQPKRQGPNPVVVRDARLSKVQAAAERGLKRFFQAQQRTALRKLRSQKADKPPVDPSLPLWDRVVEQAKLLALIEVSVNASSEQAFNSANQDYGLEVQWDLSNPVLPAYVCQRLHLIHGIDDTTAEAVRDALTEGYQLGETMSQLADRVSDVFSQAIDYRATMIARTETVQAYSAASLRAYREAGLDKAEMFDGTEYDATCAMVNGQVVSLDEASKLMLEEHPNGTRGVAPYVEIAGFAEAASYVSFDAKGVAFK